MLKKVFCICSLLTLIACDKIDISKYPEDVQNCYNKTISNTDNCTKSKKIIVKYCECVGAGKVDIKAPDRKSVSDSIRAWVDMQKLYKRCAEKTGYVFCKENDTGNK